MLTASSIGPLLVLLAFVGWLLFARAGDRARAARRLAALRAEWGKPKAIARSVNALERYHTFERSPGRPGVDAGTWRDLGMDAVYARVDRAGSFAGGARLYHRLRTPEAPLDSLRRFDEVATVFGRDARTREEVQSVFSSLEEYGQPAILDVLFGELPPPLRARRLFPLVAVLTVVALVASVASPAARVLVFLLAAVSISLRIAYGKGSLGPIDALRKTNGLLEVGRRLAGLRCESLEPELAAIRSAMGRLASLGRATSWVLADTLCANELVALLITYVNTFLLADLTALAFSLELVHRHRGDLHALFAFAGDLDAAVAVASFRAGLPAFTRPEITPGSAVLELEEAVHPLVQGAVPNGIRVRDRGVLVTGGNMSGKSTLVRTIAINALFAQTIYTTLTTRYRAPVLCVRTLMSASDDVQRSRSYYYAELEGAKGLLEPSEPATRTLVVLDELFRGTNTSERIGAGKAVLDALVRAGHFVFASTHDRELVGLLEGRFDPYHFGEDVVRGELVFPYELRRGASTTRQRDRPDANGGLSGGGGGGCDGGRRGARAALTCARERERRRPLRRRGAPPSACRSSVDQSVFMYSRRSASLAGLLLPVDAAEERRACRVRCSSCPTVVVS